MMLPVEIPHSPGAQGKCNVLPHLKVSWWSAAMCWVQWSDSASLLLSLLGNGGHAGHRQNKQKCRQGGAEVRVRGCKQGDAGKECRGCGLWGAGERVQVRNASEGGAGEGGVGKGVWARRHSYRPWQLVCTSHIITAQAANQSKAQI